MLIVISPAKTLDYSSPIPTPEFSRPALLKDSAALIEIMRTYGPNDLAGLMKISHKLGELNTQRFLEWKTPFTRKNARQAIYAFKGDVYTGIDVDTLSDEDLAFAQEHLRILSGLYGILRPLDLMQAYRLEMGTSLKNDRGDNLYQFWGNKITQTLNKQLKALHTHVVVNLASKEYFKSIDTALLDAEIITPIFKDRKNGKYKIISFYAKKARGLMSTYAIKQRITHADQLKKFKVAGYYFDKNSSTAREWVFLRDEAE